LSASAELLVLIVQDKTGLRPKKIGIGLDLAVLVLFCETQTCHARRHNDLEGRSNV